MSANPRYRTLDRVYVKAVGYAGPHQFEAGPEIQVLDAPGLSLLPLNAEGRAARLANIGDNWKYDGPGQVPVIIKIARSLGFEGNSVAGREFICQWVERETEIQKQKETSS